ncbi:MAG TPA: TatD family hydrolase [Candidatus Aminicenantes bacterium]|nr:TatD family hydrolase [Candidatus Aminicenantes bacterium]
MKRVALWAVAALVAALAVATASRLIVRAEKAPAVPNLAGKVLTVKGPVDPSVLGPMLPHEHIFIKFKTPASVAGEFDGMTADQRAKAERALARAPKDWVDQGVDKPWAKGFPPGWNTLMDFDLQLAEVLEFKRAGGGAIVDVSNFGLTRSPDLLLRISEASGLHVVMGAGWYEKAFHPRDMDLWTVDDMADIIVRDITVGAQGTRVRAGVIGEIGVEGRPLTENEIKITRASARAARITGAPMHFHSGGGTPEEKQRILDIVAEEGFDLNHVIMGHNGSGDVALQRRITDRGAYVEFDGLAWGPDSLKPEAIEDLARRIVSLIDGGLTDRILIAHDVCTNFQLKSKGGGGFGYISNLVVPALKAKGVGDETIRRIMVDNPARAMTFAAPGAPH